jgi:hypothetical protein
LGEERRAAMYDRRRLSTRFRTAPPLLHAVVLLIAALLPLAVGVVPPLSAQAPGARSFRVRETIGIRRSEYPVNVRLNFARAVLKDAANARLMTNGAEVAAQIAAVTSWDDGSVQALDVDFNASLDPVEERRYEVQYGDGVTAAAKPARGLSIEESEGAIQVGNVRFSKNGAPLIASATYRGEGIGTGANGITITDAAGQRHDLTMAAQPSLTVVKPGPLVVVLRYTASVPLDAGYSVPVELMIEMPSSKTWIKLSATVRDPSRRVRDLAVDTPLAFGAVPWLWDFGTDSGTYGVFRNPADAVVLTQRVNATGPSGWTVETVAQSQRRGYETSAGSRPKLAFGWGHLQDAKAAVAFAVEQFGRSPGVYSITLDGRGQTSFRFVPTEAATLHHLTVYEHFVATPVAIGAATNPTAMLAPPAVSVER